VSTATKTDLFTPGQSLNRNPFAELPGCLGHPSVYLVMILDGSGEATDIDSAWILQRLAEERIQESRTGTGITAGWKYTSTESRGKKEEAK
jgi:hypothetical protein